MQNARISGGWSVLVVGAVLFSGGATIAKALEPVLEAQKLLASDAAPGRYFGDTVAVSGSTAFVSSKGGGIPGVYVFEHDGEAWVETQKLAGIDFAPTAMAIAGDVVFIGDAYADIGAIQTGAVHIYTRNDSTWEYHDTLVASDAIAQDHFGRSIAVSNDTIVIGAPNHVLHPRIGSAYVFVRDGSSWVEQQKILPSDGVVTDEFGYSVSIHEDTVVVGAAHLFANQPGSAYVFTRSNSLWSEQQKLTSTDPAPNDFFGRSVSVYGDTALVGAGGSVAAYVFTRREDVWSLEKKLTSPNTLSGDVFASRVALFENTALVAAPEGHSIQGEDNGPGVVHVFMRSGSLWTELNELHASDREVYDNLGGAISFDGQHILTGAIGTHYSDPATRYQGAAYMFLAPIAECSDGIDNDEDGQADWPHDAECLVPTDPSEMADCNDGLDNGGDGVVDFSSGDEGCWGDEDLTEANQPPPGCTASISARSSSWGCSLFTIMMLLITRRRGVVPPVHG